MRIKIVAKLSLKFIIPCLAMIFAITTVSAQATKGSALITPDIGGGCTISGILAVTAGTHYTYTLGCTTTNLNWHVTNGTIISTSGYTITISWTAGFSTGQLAAYSSSTLLTSITVTITSPLVAGTITPSSATVILDNSIGAIVSTAATGGNNVYVYQWQLSSTTVTGPYSNISGANGLSYAPGNFLAVGTVYYRLAVTSNGQTVYSNTCTVTVTLPASGANPSISNNYIAVWLMTAPETNPANVPNHLIQDAKLSVQYIDGLGRPMQTVAKQGSLETSSGNSADLVAPVVYDKYGREATKYLSYPGGGTDGSYKSTFTSQQNSFYSAATTSNPINGQGETFYYGTTNFEGSPLNRPTNVMVAGNNWVGSGRGLQSGYWNNVAVDSVRIWNVTESGTTGTFGSYSSSGMYPAGLLYKEIHTDENGQQVVEFTDMDGNLILKKVQVNSTVKDNGSGSGYTGWLSTYYIYDDLKNLRAVIQPAGVAALDVNGWSLSSTILTEQCFRYEYDGLKRMIMKQVPGGVVTDMLYDNRDRLVMTQDGNQRASGDWIATLYEDVLDRSVETGIYTVATSFPTLLGAAAAATDYPFTTSTAPAYPTWELLTVNHYDDYNSIPSGISGTLNTSSITMTNFYSSYNVSPIYAQQLTQVTPSSSVTTKGLVTWTQAEVLGTGASPQYISTATIYDEHARNIQMQTLNYSGGLDITTTQYNFIGKPLVQDLHHQKISTAKPTQTYEVATLYSYDVLERPTMVQKMVIAAVITTPAWKTISTMGYDDMGHLKTKTIGNNPVSSGQPLENQSFDYNIRDWLLGMNRGYINNSSATNFFGFELGYDKTPTIVAGTSYTAAQYNGNISGTVWENGGDLYVRKYDFTYDPANRLTSASFNQYNTSFNKNDGLDFSVSNLIYDPNGNILAMRQMGWKSGTSVLIDQLGYNYFTGSNRLQNVIDTASDPNTVLGDFRYSTTYTTALGGTKTASATDYGYDNNMNLSSDKNKDITSISYNILNLPSVITVAKGTISYIYDATGEKLVKTTNEPGGTVSGTATTINTTTTYISGFVYQTIKYGTSSLILLQDTDNIQFFGQDEGRVRALYYNAGNPNLLTGFAFDYFLKDHLGNTRSVITEEQETDPYPTLTFEGANAAAVANQNAVWDNNAGQSVNVLSSRVSPLPTGFTSATNGSYCGSITKAQGAIGAGMLLRVMARDQLNVSIDYTYSSATVDNSSANGLNTLVTSIASMILNSSAVTSGIKTEAAAIASSEQASTNVDNFFSPEGASGTTTGVPPKAYLHILLFNDQFVFDNVNSVVVPITTAGLNTRATVPVQIVTAARCGYAYVYFSNESNTTVYFDNFALTDVRGPVLETNAYYPFGLTMSAISDKAIKTSYAENKYRYNGKELQHQEFSDGSGLEEYDYGARIQDPQIGRWGVIDPVANKFANETPYNYAGNNPISSLDIGGRFRITTHQYKIIEAYLNNGIQELLNSKDIVKAFQKYGGQKGGLSLQQLKNDFAKDKGPVIIFVAAPGIGSPQGPSSNVRGHTIDENTIEINKKFAELLENAKPEDKEAALFAIVEVILHEENHVGVDRSSPYEGPDREVGYLFAYDVYGNYAQGDDVGAFQEFEDASPDDPDFADKIINSSKRIIEGKRKEQDGQSTLPTVPWSFVFNWVEGVMAANPIINFQSY